MTRFLPLALFLLASPVRAQVSFKTAADEVRVFLKDTPIAVYSHADPKITRPFFHHVRLPGGPQLTRNHPPLSGKDATDHDTFHPGIWLAFGDVNGHDTWRNKCLVRQDRFLNEPRALGKEGRFTVRNLWQKDKQAEPFAREESRFTFVPREDGFVLLWDTTITPLTDRLVFGDQEEMGLGLRLATPLTVKQGGRIRNSDGQVNEKQVWGKTAKWCEYSGIVEGRRVGLLLMSHPDNFRPSWFHARDYGLLVANPFGRQAFTRGAKSRLEIPRGEVLRLRFGIAAIDVAPESDDRQATYDWYVHTTKNDW